MRTVVIIPARGGSRGIPNKNLRPLRGVPLIGWPIRAALSARGVDAVVVTTDSAAIAATALRFGAEVIMRSPDLARDDVTLDPVIADAVAQLERAGRAFELVLTVQPTSPLLGSGTIETIVARFASESDLSTVLTAVDDTHLSWTQVAGRYVPAYDKRLNRQQLPPRFKETGGVLGTRRAFVRPDGRFGPNVDLHVVSAAEGCDIDTPDNWLFAEAALGRRRIAIVTIGNREQGMGHVTRVMSLVESLTGHVVEIFCDPREDLATRALSERFFPCRVVPRAERLDALREFGPDIVVHDELDTRADDLAAERRLGARIVCFEDRGAGREHADLLFDELYPAGKHDPAHGRYFGPAACVLRDEFFHAPRRGFAPDVGCVLLTFGGTDPTRLTHKVLDAIGADCPARLVVVAGKGVRDRDELAARCEALARAGANVVFHHDVTMMSEVMAEADIAFSSAGRTLYELAHLRVPTIVLAQNAVELEHTFGSPEHGFLPLGLGSRTTAEAIRSSFEALYHSSATRRALWERMDALDLTSGRERVVHAILEK
jgi:CMP-N-acetylneuraminic acid synthetase